MLAEGKVPYQNNLRNAAEVFNWQHEEKTLQEIFSPFLNSK